MPMRTGSAAAGTGTHPRGKDAIRAGLAGAGYLAGAGLLANAANVATTFVLSHFLSSRGYGAFNLLVYLFLVLSMPGYAVVVAVVRQVSRWESLGRTDRIAEWVRRWRLVSLVVAVAVLVASVAAGPAIARALSLSNASGITPILTAGAAWALLSIDRGLIQAQRRYGALAVNLLVEAGARTGVTLALVAAGMGVQGAMLAILCSAAFADAHARFAIARQAPWGARGARGALEEIEIASAGGAPFDELHSATSTRDFLAALSALALLASLAGLDVIVLGQYAPNGSGAYAAIAVVAKVLFFAALILSGYLLPEATTRWHRGEHAFRQLAITLGFLLVATATEEGVALAGARPVLGIVFPHRLLSDSGQMPVLVAAMGLLAINVILTYYLLGIGRRSVIGELAAGTGLLAILLVAAGGKPGATVGYDLAAQAALTAVLSCTLGIASRTRPTLPAPREIRRSGPPT